MGKNPPGEANLRLEISRVESVFDGMSFGDAGAYEKITGRAYGETDPAHALNSEIVNLDKAPKNAAGLVEYWLDFCLLKPTDISKGNRRLLYDAPNRGDKLALLDINDSEEGATTNDPVTVVDAGNGYLMRQGYTILFCAWQGNVQAENNRMLVGFPVATNGDAPITGLTREEFTFGHSDSPGVMPLSYPAHEPDQGSATLTVRQQETDPRTPVAAENWRFLSPQQVEIDLVEGFQTGALYEFIYTARDPIVMGLGLAAVRDIVAFMRHDGTDAAGQANPLNLGADGPAIDHVIAYGRSQPGRFLREFLYMGFNEDLEGRRVIDGMFVTTTGARRMFLNQPFSQPPRFHRKHEDHQFPGDQFPFTYANRSDPVSGQSGGILDRSLASNTCPKIIHGDSSTEYWLGRSSLLVSDEKGRDIELPDEVRAFLYSGTGHAGPSMLKHAAIFSQDPIYPLNLLNYNSLNRSLLAALDDWATRGIEPPESRVPRVRDGTLAPAEPQSAWGFPDIPEVRICGKVNELCELDYEQQPPEPIPGHDYVVLVPTVDADGNEVAGIRLPEIAAPVSTYTGWNIRAPHFAEGAAMMVGASIPFAATAEERKASGDPRLSLEERYPSDKDYREAVMRAATELHDSRLLLAEDVERYANHRLAKT